MEKQTGKQTDTLNSQNLSNKTDELKQIESIFQKKTLLNDLTIYNQNYYTKYH